MSLSGDGRVASLLAMVVLMIAANAVTAGPANSRALQRPAPKALHDDTEELAAYRLPRHFLPTQYTLRLQPNMDPTYEGEQRRFQGLVTIRVTAQVVTDTITLHATEIEVEKVHVRRMEDDEEMEGVLMKDWETDKTHDFLKLHLTGAVDIGASYRITIEYSGKLWDDMYGFYVSTYKDKNNEEKLLVATQFQATYARRAFPCFDEPNFKAQFLVTIIAPEEMNVLSNMPSVETTELSDGLKEVRFENTMVMSTYLLAFVVSPFDAVADTGSDGEVRFTTWARPEALGWADYSLKVSRPMLNVLEEYTNIPYSSSGISKVDQVALPDFAAGAMENWGLITYRETALLYNEGSADAKKRVATVIAHELLHMWFGNLVTTDWWDTTWLNEGFARFFQYYITDEVETTWRMWDQFLVDQHQMVFALDAVPNAKALTHDVYTPAQVSASFGSITYNKGASVLRMISHTIGADNFRSALHEYLKENEYENTRPSDLFDKLKVYSEDANLDEEEFVKFLVSWTETPGYPVVSVERDYSENKCTLSQVRYLLKEGGTGDEKYYVPITWTSKGQDFDDTVPKRYLVFDENLVIDNMPKNNEWVIFNVQETGYYRVNYDHQNWQMLASQLQDINQPLDEVHRLNRAQLLDDAFNLARVGLLDYETAFELADYLPRETDYVPWASAITAFAYLDRMLVNHAKYPVLQRYLLRQLDQKYERFDIQKAIPSSDVEKLFMNRITTMACSHENEKCIERAKSYIVSYVENGESIPADLRSVVYCYGVRHTNDAVWNALWNIYKESKDDVEKGLLVNGLSCSKNEDRLNELLGYTIDGSNIIRKQDTSSVFTAVYSNPSGVEVALHFLDEKFDDVRKYYGSMGAINNILTGIAGRLTTEDQLYELKKLVSNHEEDLESTGEAAIAIVEDNVRWLSDNAQKITSILDAKELEAHRLPTVVSPESYILHFEPHFYSKTFSGQVSINVIAGGPTDIITLHSSNLEIKTIEVNDQSEDIYQTHSFDKKLEILKLLLSRKLVPGSTYTIDITFSGILREDMYGFYISTYENYGTYRQIAATQFQATQARSAFPCFDEPTFKSTFTVSIKVPSGYHALGNMPQINTRQDLYQFQKTPPMPTYLLAFVVSDFLYEEDSKGEVLFRTWTRPEARPWANYSMVVSRDILEQLEEYMGIPYTDPTLDSPMTKVDQVALPDFAAGAMENWGLVTYRETALLYNDGTASARKSVATIIAHELAHMWFGNLVTTDWWDATWLNEGFAQYFQYFITDKVKPSWRLMDQFLVDHHQAVFASDSLSTSVALTYPAYTPAQVMSRFSGITYSKGGSILRMISAIIGEEHFRSALHEYLKEHSYGTTKPQDLFAKFSDKSNEAGLEAGQFTLLLESWTKQPGFPVVTINRANENGEVTISQKRFILKDPESEDETLYYIPLTWAKEGDDFAIRLPQKYITSSEKQITVNTGVESGTWVIFNVRETGFYRVNYDEENWKLITDYLKDSTKSLSGIHVLNRAQLLDDAFNLARAGLLSYDTAVDVSDYLYRETDYIPWASAFSAFSYLQRMLHHEERYNYFEEYTLQLLEHLYEDYQFEDQEHHIEKLLLNRVSAWACSLQMESCINSASTALDDYLNKEREVPADLRSVVYCYGIRHSPAEYWDKMWVKYRNTKDNAERAIIMAGLACSHDESKLEQLLRSSIDGTIRKQDASSVFTAVYGNTVGVDVALDFLDNNFEDVEESYGSMGAINNIVIGISGRLTTEEQELKMKSFVDRHRDSLGATADNALETVQENLQWLKEYADDILDVLEKRVTSAVTTTSSSAGTTSSSEGTTTSSEGTTTSSAGTTTSSGGTRPTTTPEVTTPSIIPTTDDAHIIKYSVLLMCLSICFLNLIA